MAPSRSRLVYALIAFLLAMVALAACSPSTAASAGSAGAIALFVLGLLLAGGLTTTQVGCDDDIVGPCLSPLPPPGWDLGEDMEVDVGPCLSPPLDMEVDVGPCLSQDIDPEVDVGPCLEAPFDMGGEEMGALTPYAPQRGEPTEREELLEKLSDRLPADVLAKLRGDERGDA